MIVTAEYAFTKKRTAMGNDIKMIDTPQSIPLFLSLSLTRRADQNIDLHFYKEITRVSKTISQPRRRKREEKKRLEIM